MCIQCNRQFKSKAALRSHKKDSPKHRATSNVSPSASNTAKAPTSGPNEIVTAPEPEAGRNTVEENNSIEEPLTELEYQPRPQPLLLPRLGLHAPKASVLKGDPDVDAVPTAVDILMGCWVLPFFETDNPVASAPVEHQEAGIISESHELVVPEVPAPWSSIPLNDRDQLLDALQAQCHSIESLEGEGYWTQTPSPVDIDMTRQCSDCGGKKSSNT